MTLRKFATLAVIDARMWDDTSRTAHRASFAYSPRPGFLYVRSRAISSRTNDNFDHFPAEEISANYRSFIGKPVFVNHHNSDHRRARGVIIDAALHEDVLADGQPDTWVELLHEVDAVKFPKLAAAILAGEVERTSMGCDVAFSICSVCNNRASTPLDYCRHIPSMKGQKVRRVTASGTQEDVLVYEKCYGLKFFENSLLVEEPADPTAFVTGVDDRGVQSMGLAKAASKPPAAPVTASFVSTAGQASYTLVDTGGAGGYSYELHIAGCGDLSQPKYSDMATTNFAADSIEAAVAWAVDDDLGFSSSDLKVFPCARSGVAPAAPAQDPNVCPGSGMALASGERRLQVPCPACGKLVKAGDMRTGRMRKDIPRHSPSKTSASTASHRAPEGVPMARRNAAQRREAFRHHVAYGETMAPSQVSTLRDDSCPVCGETNGFNGERCMTCGYFKPPDDFMDPDLTKAKEVDLRQDKEETAEIDDTGDTDDVFNLDDPEAGGDPEEAAAADAAVDEAIPGEPDDQAQLNGEVRSGPATTPAQEGADDAVRAAPEVKEQGEDQGTESPIPDPHPRAVVNDSEKTLLKGDVFQLEKPTEEVQERSKPDAVVAPKPDAPEAKGDSVPKADDESEDDDSEDAKNDDEEDDDESDFPPKKKKSPKQATRRNRGESTMRPALRALAEQQIMLQANKKAIQAIASLAGVDVSGIYTLAERRVASLHRTADAENPAQPLPEPAAEAPSETTAEALGDLNDADVESVGTATTEDGLDTKVVDVTEVGGVMPEEPAQTADVEKPVEGSSFESQDATLEGDVKARGLDAETAFPIEAANRRVFASLRLARARLDAGIATGDDLTLGEQIARSTASLRDITTETETLTQVRRATASRTPGVPVRTDRRSMPSLGATTASASTAPIAGSDSSLDDSLLFL